MIGIRFSSFEVELKLATSTSEDYALIPLLIAIALLNVMAFAGHLFQRTIIFFQ